MKTLIIILISIFSLTSRGEPLSPRVEPLMGVLTSVKGVQIQVESHGCTFKNSFKVQKERRGDTVELTFIRIEDDTCLALYYHGKVLTYSYKELGLESGQYFIVRNPRAYSKVSEF